MDDSDDEFKELCAKLLRRVKRNADEGNNNTNRRGPQNVKTSTAAKTSLKKPKPVAKTKRKDETAGKKGSLCAKSEVESNRLPFEQKESGSEAQAACTSNVLAHMEEAFKVPVSASQGRNKHPRPQPEDDGKTCLQMAPFAENPEVMCEDTFETNAQPSADIQTAFAVGLQLHSERQTTPIFGVTLPTDSELSSHKYVQPRVDIESAEVLRTPVNASAPEKNIPPRFTTQTTPVEHVQCQVASKTVRAKMACPKVVDEALEKMQQFKRTDPRRMKHSAEESSTATSDMILLVQDQLENVKDLTISVTQSDRDFALALQQDIPNQNKVASLEEEGLYFCQLCQKDLSAMNSALRQQHMNRCLDEVETSVSLVPVSVSSRIPECPICGKHFNTSKSRATHLKRCATTMQVSPQMLLQAVQMQTLNSEVSLPVVSSTAAWNAKRKGSTKETGPSKKQKHSVESTKAEEMLVALVMSRSLLDQESQDGGSLLASGKTEVTQFVRMRAGAEKKSRKKKKEAPPPPLLIQDPETAIKQIQNRVAALLTEEMELACTPVLPASRFWDKNQEIEWRRSSPEGRSAVLWQYSAMMDTPPLEFFYTKELVPPISAWTTTQNAKPAIFPPVVCNEKQLLLLPQPSTVEVNTDDDVPLVPAQTGLSPQRVSSSRSQMDKEAFQDLMDLAGEGITLTQWKLGADQNPSIDASGKESVVSDIAQSGFVPFPKDNIKERRRSCSRSTLQLNTLAVDFGGMVNNPHLSDVQFQMDCGAVLYAHLFVLYARCPLLVELVHSEGFLAEEDGDARTRRVLLNDVSADATCSFLRYLYCASTDISSCCLSDVAALSVRFGVSELLNICESNNLGTPVSEGIASEDELFCEEKEENHGGKREDHFQELLKSMWVDEDEVLAELEAEGLEDNESLVEDEKVNEDELNEIYEFASTQRKVGVDRSGEDTEVDLDSETENTQNLHQKTGYALEHVNPSERKWEELLEYNFMEHEPSAPSFSNDKNPGLLQVTKDTRVASEGKTPAQCNQPECSYITESHIPKSKEKSTLGNVAEHFVDELDSPTLLQAVTEDNNDDLLKEPSSSQQSHHGLNNSYDRMFLDTFDEYLEPSQVDYRTNDLESKVVKKCGEVSHSALLSNGLQESLPSETTHCKKTASQCFSVLPALGLSPPSSNPDRTPLFKENPQSQSSPYESNKPGISLTTPLKLPPHNHCLNLQPSELGGSGTRPTKVSPHNLASQYSSPEPCKEKAQFFHSSQHSPRLLFPSPEPDRSNDSTESQRSPFSYLESMRKKNNGALFSAEAVSKLKKVVQGIALNYSNRMKQDTDSPTKTSDLSKQSTVVQTQCSFVEKDNIIVLDSDEETELEQQIKKSPTYSPFSMKQDLLLSTSAFGKVKTSPQLLTVKTTCLFDLDQNESSSVPASEACKDGNITPEMESSSNLKLHLSCDDDEQGHEETSSSMETSWLVPATPLLSQSRNCSSRTQLPSFQNLSKLKQRYSPNFETSVDDIHSLVNVATNKPKETLNLSLKASQLQESYEENSKYPLTANSLASRISAQDLGNKDNVNGNTIKQSPTKSLTIPCMPSLGSSNRISKPVYMPSESPYSATNVASVDQSSQKESSDSSVFEVEDRLGDHTEDPLPSSGSLQMDFELPIPAEECWNIEYLTPAKKDKSNLDEPDSLNFTRLCRRESDSGSVLLKSQAKHLNLTSIRHGNKSLYQHNSERPEHESSLQMEDSLQNSKLSFLNASEWDDWNGEEDNLPVAIHLSQSIPNQPPSTKHKTPLAAFHKQNQVPAVPITPLPSYSDMDTPKLKKELDRFGVRALPKRKMVLKLKEIFQYTHQTMSSDEEIPTSQLQERTGSVCLSQPIDSLSAQRQGRCNTAAPRKRKPTISRQPPSDSSSEHPKKTTNHSFKKPAKSQKTSLTAAKKKRTATFSPKKSPVKDALPTITASQESTASSAAGSDISFESQSSSTNEFETAFASGEEEDDEFITSSQVAVQEKDKAEAVRRYLHLNPDLYNKILLYEPIELAGLQAELKQNGIKIPMGKLLDFLDAHCITFTTAAARKEKLERKQKKQGKKKLTAKRY